MPTGSTSRHESSPFSLLLLLSILFALFHSPQPAFAAQKNFTIDDQKTGVVPVYVPPSAWDNELCSTCAIRPEPQMLHDGTAMSATFGAKDPPYTLDFDFNGTAIYIYFTLVYNEGDGITVNTECNFTLDSEPRVLFNHSGDPTKPLRFRDYNTLVYSKTGLTHDHHHMTISMSDVDYDVFLSFDYAMYSAEQLDITTLPATITSSSTNSVFSSAAGNPGRVPESTQSTLSPASSNTSQTSLAIIVGSVLGSLTVLTGLTLLLYLYRRNRRRGKQPVNPGPTALQPFFGTGWTPRHGGIEVASTGGSSWNEKMTPVTPIIGPTRQGGTTQTTQPASSGSGLWSGKVSVKHHIQAVTRRVQSLRERITSDSGRTASLHYIDGSVSASSSGTQELTEELERLRQEIQLFKESQNLPTNDEPPPYTDGPGIP